jgi:twitching motility two-component system response regulator PilH
MIDPASTTIVIADDSPTLRRIVSGVLTREGYNVVIAEDGMSAVQAVFRTQPDLVVMDVQMPRLSGYVAARLLKEDWSTRDIPVVLLTSLDSASDRYWGDKAGADRYLTKDFEAGDLAGTVAALLAEFHQRRDGRERLRPDLVELTDDDVIERTCDVLDRTLFQTSLAGDVTALAASTGGFEHIVAGLLDVVGRVVDLHLAGVVLVDERAAWLSVTHEVARDHYDVFLRRAADMIAGSTGVPFPVEGLDARVMDLGGLLGADDEASLETFLSMPLRGAGGRVVGVLALSSSYEDAFGDAALSTLRLLEGPAALVIDNARLRLKPVGAIS